MMSYFKIDEKNEIYYEYEPPKDNGYTCVFVNALTGDTSAWTGLIGENLKFNEICPRSFSSIYKLISKF